MTLEPSFNANRFVGPHGQVGVQTTVPNDSGEVTNPAEHCIKRKSERCSSDSSYERGPLSLFGGIPWNWFFPPGTCGDSGDNAIDVDTVKYD